MLKKLESLLRKVSGDEAPKKKEKVKKEEPKYTGPKFRISSFGPGNLVVEFNDVDQTSVRGYRIQNIVNDEVTIADLISMFHELGSVIPQHKVFDHISYFTAKYGDSAEAVINMFNICRPRSMAEFMECMEHIGIAIPVVPK